MTLSPLLGTFQVPGDKSISHRALMLSAITLGKSSISGLADNADVRATKRCLEDLGAVISDQNGILSITGNPMLKSPAHQLDAANSGTTIRLLSGILAAQSFPTKISGDESLQKRPMARIIEPLSQMEALITGSQNNRFPPLFIQPASNGLRGIDYYIPVASAQVKSAILLAGLYAHGSTTVEEPHPSRDHTERMLKYAGVTLQSHDKKLVLPEQQITQMGSRHWEIPGDSSSAAFLTVAALCIPGSEIHIENIGLNPGRTGFIEALRSVGAYISIENQREACGESVGDLTVKASTLKGELIITAEQVPTLIDELPILAIAGLFLEGKLSVQGAAELRHKESDRIQTMAQELEKLGFRMETFPDGFSIISTGFRPQKPQAMLSSHQDHRIAMSLMTLNRIISVDPIDRWNIQGREWVNVSFPAFEQLLFK